MEARVIIKKVSTDDCREIIAGNVSSIGVHEPWVYPCRDESSFFAYLARCDGERCHGFVARHWETGRVIGVVNLSEIVRGSLSERVSRLLRHGGDARTRVDERGRRSGAELCFQPAGPSSRRLRRALRAHSFVSQRPPLRAHFW